MERHPFLRLSGLIFTFSAIVQAATWIILSLTGILLHEYSPMALEAPKGFFEKIAYQMYQIYFIGKKGALDTNSKGSEGFMLVFLILQLIMSAFWLGSASYQLYILLNEKYDKVKNSFACCAVATLGVSVIDFEFGCGMAITLDKVLKEIFKISSKGVPTDWQYVDVIVVGLMMTLAFRGFVLWLVNVVSAIAMLTIVYRIYKREKREKKRMFEYFKRTQAFDQISNRRASLYPEAVNDAESRPTLGFIVSSMADIRDLQQLRPNQIPEDRPPNGGLRSPQIFHGIKPGPNSSLYPHWSQDARQPEQNYAKIGRSGGRNKNNGLSNVQPPVAPYFEDNFRSRPVYGNEVY